MEVKTSEKLIKLESVKGSRVCVGVTMSLVITKINDIEQ